MAKFKNKFIEILEKTEKFHKIKVSVPVFLVFYDNVNTKIGNKTYIEMDLYYYNYDHKDTSKHDKSIGKNFIYCDNEYVRKFYPIGKKYDVVNIKNEIKDVIANNIPSAKDLDFKIQFNNSVRIPYQGNFYVTPQIIEIWCKDTGLRKYKIYQIVNKEE